MTEFAHVDLFPLCAVVPWRREVAAASVELMQCQTSLARIMMASVRGTCLICFLKKGGGSSNVKHMKLFCISEEEEEEKRCN